MEEMLNVKLISYSQAAEHSTPREVDTFGNYYTSVLDQIAYAARVSNPANQNNSLTNEKLVRYLINNHHWSPLEMVSATLEIETTRDIARQILRHRSFSFQEFSQRYADASQLGFTFKECRTQDLKNRQSSNPTDDAELAKIWHSKQVEVKKAIEDAYSWALTNGIAKEQARAVLPEGMTNSRMYMAGTMRSWWHYIWLRTDKGTQKEHREVAEACAEALKNIFPMIAEAVNTRNID
jgi:thymidylate synthase (FAD)